ncbi:substrate-binding domain-containing protein [Salana multivorans]
MSWRPPRRLGFTGPDPLARSLRRGRSGVIGVVSRGDLALHFRDPVAIRMLDGIADALDAHNRGMLLIRAGADPVAEEAGGDERGPVPGGPGGTGGAGLVARTAMDAAIFLHGPDPEDPVVLELVGRGVPVVLMESVAPGVSSVVVDDASGLADLARRVREAGHERVALVTLPWDGCPRSGLREDIDPTHAGPRWTSERVAGVLAGGIEPMAVYETQGSLVEEGFEAAKVLLALPEPPTAIMAFSDLLAAGVVLAAREAGLRIPEDLSVTGFDGVDLPWLAPDVLESVEQPAVRKGQLASELAIAMSRGEEPAQVELAVWPRPGTTLGPAPTPAGGS